MVEGIDRADFKDASKQQASKQAHVQAHIHIIHTHIHTYPARRFLFISIVYLHPY